MEGPWLNPDPGYRGAHRPEWMQKPSRQLLADWQNVAGNLVKLITLAPEVDLDASADVIRAGLEQGIQFFIGHSGAMGETLARACEAGATWLDASRQCRPGRHAEIRECLVARARPTGPACLAYPGRISRAAACVSRAGPGARPAPAPDHRRDGGRWGRRHVRTIYAGRDARGDRQRTAARGLPDSGRLAGSTLTPFAGVFLAEQMAGIYPGGSVERILHGDPRRCWACRAASRQATRPTSAFFHRTGRRICLRRIIAASACIRRGERTFRRD